MNLPDIYDDFTRMSARGLRARTSSGRPGGTYRNFFKRLIDVTLVLMALPVVLPSLVLIALFVARDGASPIYWDQRVGRNGRIFKMMKLRTMVPNAREILDEHLAADPAAAREWAHNQKLKHDPRITRIGKLLRKSSVDELPQLWNVLKGDMSLVGPRPMAPSQVDLYPGTDYFDLRPGLTGPWQVSDRHNSAFAKRAQYDAEYNARVSLLTDLKLILCTVTVVMKGTGC